MDSVAQFFEGNPKFGWLFIVAIGVFLFVGTLLKWEWVLSPSRRGSFLRWIFGPRGEMFIISTVLIVAGMVLFILV